MALDHVFTFTVHVRGLSEQLTASCSPLHPSELRQKYAYVPTVVSCFVYLLVLFFSPFPSCVTLFVKIRRFLCAFGCVSLRRDPVILSLRFFPPRVQPFVSTAFKISFIRKASDVISPLLKKELCLEIKFFPGRVDTSSIL